MKSISPEHHYTITPLHHLMKSLKINMKNALQVGDFKVLFLSHFES